MLKELVVEKEIITSVKFVGSNGETVTIPNVRVHVGPGPEDCDPHISELLGACIINLLEKKGKGYQAKKEAHFKQYGYNRDHQTFHTVEIEETLVSRTGWRSMVRTSLMDDYVQGEVV